jgi:hypothetical protein
MRMVIVPDSLRAAINEKLDAALAELPEEDRIAAEKDREFLYGQLLDAFDQHGTIPDFTLAPNLPEFRVTRE